jgi:hypothetical protein
MRIPLQLLCLSGAASIVVLAGCSVGSQSATPAAPLTSLGQSISSKALLSHPVGFVNAAAVSATGGNQIIDSDAEANTVSVFGASGQLNALLTAGLSQPTGIDTDSAQNLYVANTQDFNVLVYSKPYKSVGLTLDNTGFYSADVAVSQAGIVAVTNEASNPYGPGAVRFYAKGSSTACATVTDPGWQGMQFGAFDASGRLIFDGYDRDGNPLVGSIAGGCKATSITTLTFTNTLQNPQAVQIVHGKVLILDQEYNTFSPTIFTYAAPVGNTLGSPTVTTKLSAGIEMMTFAMLQDDNNLWIAHSDAAVGRIKYSYPGGLFVRSFNQPSLQSAYGIAVNPVAAP